MMKKLLIVLLSATYCFGMVNESSPSQASDTATASVHDKKLENGHVKHSVFPKEILKIPAEGPKTPKGPTQEAIKPESPRISRGPSTTDLQDSKVPEQAQPVPSVSDSAAQPQATPQSSVPVGAQGGQKAPATDKLQEAKGQQNAPQADQKTSSKLSSKPSSLFYGLVAGGGFTGLLYYLIFKPFKEVQAAKAKQVQAEKAKQVLAV